MFLRLLQNTMTNNFHKKKSRELKIKIRDLTLSLLHIDKILSIWVNAQ